jgi:ABC-type polysaccharide transport system permease subunit
MINVWLLKLGQLKQPIDFLANEDLVWPLQTFVGIWKGLGWTAIIFISAIAGIEQELYEAAIVDGAGRFQKIRHITLPGIMPTFVVMMILSIGYLMSAGFEQYYLFYNGMVASHIEIIDTYVYRIGIAQGNYSFATAVGISKTLISVFLLLGANWLSKRTTQHSFF